MVLMKQLTDNWLSKLCGMLHGADSAVVFSTKPNEAVLAPTSFWPEDDHDISYAPRAIQEVLAKKRPVLLQQKAGSDAKEVTEDIIACPLFITEKFHGIVVVRMPNRPPLKQQAAVQQIRGAALWFDTINNQQTPAKDKQLITMVEIVASCLEHDRYQSAATDVMTDLAARLSCDRISIGFLHNNRVSVEAVSHSAGFDNKSNLISGISDAMLEAMEQDTNILYQSDMDDALLLTRSHASFADAHEREAILTVPFTVNGEIAGAMLAERSSGNVFDQDTREHFEQITSMIGPVLDIRRREEQWLPQKIATSFKNTLSHLIGPGHLSLKVTTGSIIFILLFMSFFSSEYRVTGNARLEAMLQRVVVAPQNGFITESNVRPGDIIQNNDVLGTLDNKDLTLEYQRWASQLEQLHTEARESLASHERFQVNIIKAKIQQAEAQMELVSKQLERTRLIAPFDGIIVSGDLSQSLGSPVERGQVLFTVAPLNAYRIILKVDERDISNIKTGQQGHLILSSMPRQPFPITVEKITPVSTAKEGRNYFHIEASIGETSEQLRPGMEGIAKINIERRKLIWIWTHNLVDWLRLALWTYKP